MAKRQGLRIGRYSQAGWEFQTTWEGGRVLRKGVAVPICAMRSNMDGAMFLAIGCFSYQTSIVSRTDRLD